MERKSNRDLVRDICLDGIPRNPRTRQQRLRIAEMVLEAYRNTPGYRKTASGHWRDRDEPGEPQKTEYLKVSPEALKRKKQWDARQRLKKKDAVPTKAGKPVFEEQEKKHTVPNLQSQIGQVYFHRCPDNPNYYKTILIKHNPFTNALQPLMSNAIYGEPPDGMPEISPLMLSRLTRLASSPFFDRC